MVLDDSVEHDVHAAIGVRVGMCVLPRNPSVRRPSGVTDAGGRLG